MLLLIIELKIFRKNGDFEIYKFRKKVNDVFSVSTEFLEDLLGFFQSKCMC